MDRAAAPASLVWATSIDVLALDRQVERRDGYLVIRSPSNPTYYWGNLLLFGAPPRPGDGARWEDTFRREFGDGDVRHRTFAWDRVDGTLGAAREEFIVRGYQLDETVGLVAAPDELRPHPRENRTVTVRPLAHEPGPDDRLWEQVVELQTANRDPEHDEASYRAFSARRLADLRELFAHGRGAWYVALHETTVVGSCGIVVTGRCGRFQVVDTSPAHRRQGICSRLVVAAAAHAAREHDARQLVIAADAHYHALRLYESLGFRRRERVSGVWRAPAS